VKIIRADLEKIKEIPAGDLCIGVERPKKYIDMALEKSQKLTIFSLRPDEELVPYPDKPYDRPGVRVTDKLPDPQDMLKELRTMLVHTNLSQGLFHANHASNYLPIRARLPKDKDRTIALIDQAISGNISLKPEYLRGL